MWEMQEMKFLSLGWKDPLEQEMVARSRILAWRIPTDRGALCGTVHRATKSWIRRKQLSTHDVQENKKHQNKITTEKHVVE